MNVSLLVLLFVVAWIVLYGMKEHTLLASVATAFHGVEFRRMLVGTCLIFVKPSRFEA